MSDKSKIEWTDATWNPVTGCTKVSEGCRNCYAMTFAERWRGTPGHYFENGFDITLRPDKLEQPYRWKRPRKIFVNSMSDLFHESIPDEYIWNVFQVMARCPQHIFQVLTKRPERMMQLLNERYWRNFGDMHALILKGLHEEQDVPFLPNVWLGVSVENQKAADERIPLLLQTPAAVRFLSCEPLLGPVDLGKWIGAYYCSNCEHRSFDADTDENYPDDEQCLDCGLGAPIFDLRDGIPIHWVIVGGESGTHARPMHPDWAMDIRDQCQAAGVPFFFKQFGEWAPIHELRCNEPGIKGKHWYNFDPDTSVCKICKHNAGRLLDGRTWDEMPV